MDRETVNFLQFADCRFGGYAASAAPNTASGTPDLNTSEWGLGAGDKEFLAALAAQVVTTRAEIVLIPGGLFDREQAVPTAVNEVFAALANFPPVFIAPGQADYLSPLSPYSPLARARRGLKAIPENITVFGSSMETHFLLTRSDVAVSGCGLAGREIPANILLDGESLNSGAALSILLLPTLGKTASKELLSARAAYIALGCDSVKRNEQSKSGIWQITDGLGNIRAAALAADEDAAVRGRGRVLSGRITADGAVDLRHYRLDLPDA